MGVRRSDRAIINALISSGGMVTMAARRLGIARQTIHARAQRSPQIKEAIAAAREEMLDEAETQLRRAVGQGEPWAVCFALKTIGRQRGYVERTELAHSAQETIRVDLSDIPDDVLEALEARTGGTSGER